MRAQVVYASPKNPQLRVVPIAVKRHHTPVQPRSYGLLVPEGAYARIRAWDGRAKWMIAFTETLRSDEGKLVRASIVVKEDKILKVAALDAESADSRTGRGVMTAHQTVAQTIGCSRDTVRRARRIIRQLGFSITVVIGRYLTDTERTEATKLHGGKQRRAASVRALTIPGSGPRTKTAPLPRQGLSNPLSYLRNYSPKRAKARKAASRPEANRKNLHQNRPSYTPAVAHLAAELTNRLPFLGKWRSLVSEKPGQRPVLRHQGKHIGSICKIIVTSGIDTQRLTAADVLDVLDRITKETLQVTLTGDFVSNPLGYLTALLRRVKAYVQHTAFATAAERQQAAAVRREQVIAEQTAARAERAAERARANTPEAIAAREAFFAAHNARKAARQTP